MNELKINTNFYMRDSKITLKKQLFFSFQSKSTTGNYV